MTTRQLLIRHQQQYMIAFIPCGVAFLVGAWWGHIDKWGYLVAAAGVVALFAFGIFNGVRCVHCNKRLDQKLKGRGSWWMVDEEVRHCPYCGVSLDEPAKKNNAA